MDEADRAQIYEEQARERGIRNATLQHDAPPLIIGGKRACVDCEEEINPKRVEAVNAIRCEVCQPFYEMRSNR